MTTRVQRYWRFKKSATHEDVTGCTDELKCEITPCNYKYILSLKCLSCYDNHRHFIASLSCYLPNEIHSYRIVAKSNIFHICMLFVFNAPSDSIKPLECIKRCMLHNGQGHETFKAFIGNCLAKHIRE